MKKLITLAAVAFAFARVDAQVVVNVVSPLDLGGDYQSTWADPAQGWGTPDMTILANGITDTLALAFDGSAADSLCCEAVINRAEIEGKIAVLYRGTCNFSLKALNCQDSGAVAVIIINNVDAAPIPLGAGTYGADVTIPTFLVEKAGGEAIAAALAAGDTVVAYLGNKTGLYEFDLGYTKEDILMPPSAGQPAIFCQNPGEYTPRLGAWVRNYGSQDQTGVTLNVTIDLAGTGEVYNQTSTPVDVLTGDSVFIELNPLDLASYGGQYTLTYTCASPAAEEYASDNTYSTTLNVGDVFSYARLNPDGTPASTAAVRPATPSGDYTYCVHFRDPHASRAAATGMYIRATVNAPGSLAGELFNIEAFEWTDDFTGLSDANFTISSLNQVGSGELLVEPDTTTISTFLQFDAPVILQDDMRYLFCLTTSDPTVVFLGSADDPNYDTNEEQLDQPTAPLQNGTTWSVGFVGTISANAVRMIDVNTIGIPEHTEAVGTPYPNPTVGMLNIPFNVRVNNAQLRILDIAGKLVAERRVSTEGRNLQVNVADIAPGTYQFELTNNGKRSTFKVVISR